MRAYGKGSWQVSEPYILLHVANDHVKGVNFCEPHWGSYVFFGVACEFHNLGFPWILDGKFWWSSNAIRCHQLCKQLISVIQFAMLVCCAYIISITWLSHPRSMNACTIQVILHQPKRKPYLLNGVSSKSLSTHLPPQTSIILWPILMQRKHDYMVLSMIFTPDHLRYGAQPLTTSLPAGGTTCGHSILRQATHSVCLPVLFLTSSGALTKHIRQPV